MTKYEKQILTYLTEHPGTELYRLSGEISLADAHLVREHIHLLLEKRCIKYTDPTSRKLKITPLGTELLEVDIENQRKYDEAENKRTAEQKSARKFEVILVVIAAVFSLIVEFSREIFDFFFK